VWNSQQFDDRNLTSRRYPGRMRTMILFLFILPTALIAQPHTGVIHTRSMPELSDIALFVMAVLGVWIVRRAMRARFAARRED
jgi:hypothetical protein